MGVEAVDKRLIERYFSTHYQRYLPQSRESWEKVIQRIELNFGKYFDALPRDAAILDVPCGVGYLEDYLLRKGFKNIEAVDISEEQVKAAQEKVSEFHPRLPDQVTFHVADAFEYLTPKFGSYAAIAMLDFVEHLPKDRVINVLDLAHRALEQKGLLFVRTVNAVNLTWSRSFYHDLTHQTPFTPESIHQALVIARFEVLEIKYEVLPRSPSTRGQLKEAIRRMGLALLAKLLGIPRQAFTENLIAVARKA